MPIYEYQCPECHTIFEEWQSISAAKDFFACPQCAAMSSRIISNTAFVLKGSGWYVTEYGNRKANQESSGTKTAATQSTDTTQNTATAQTVEKTAKPEQASAQNAPVPSAGSTSSAGASQNANA